MIHELLGVSVVGGVVRERKVGKGGMRIRDIMLTVFL